MQKYITYLVVLGFMLSTQASEHMCRGCLGYKGYSTRVKEEYELGVTDSGSDYLANTSQPIARFDYGS